MKLSAHGVTATSLCLKQRAIDLGIAEEKILYLPSGCDYKNISPQNPTQSRKEIGIPEDGMWLCFVGFSLWDTEMIIDALPRVWEVFPETKLLLVGNFTKYIGTTIPEDLLEKKIFIRGPVKHSELNPYLSSADIALLPLRDNTVNHARGPIKLGDYMAAGLPILTNKVGDTGIIVSKEKIGIATEQANLAEGIIELLKNENFRKEMGTRARTLAETTYSWSAQAEVLEKFYNKNHVS